MTISDWFGAAVAFNGVILMVIWRELEKVRKGQHWHAQVLTVLCAKNGVTADEMPPKM